MSFFGCAIFVLKLEASSIANFGFNKQKERAEAGKGS